MIIVFDLDDTLYEEISFVRSGYMAVAHYLEKKHGLSYEKSFSFMIEHALKFGRQFVFNKLLDKHKLNIKKNVNSCLSIYRQHKPTIALYPDAQACFLSLKNYPIYIVTDGNKNVQRNKLKALGLFDKAKFCFITHRYGRQNSKPSPYCFLKICAKEMAKPQEVIYIADNPTKDFVGIKPLGFKTVRILQGPYKNVRLNEQFEAEHIIHSLKELNLNFLNQLK
ncbi:MAG: HAD family hydrolase [bacterium]